MTPPARKGELGAQCCGWQQAGRQALRRSAIYWKHRHGACFAMLMQVRLGHACCELSIKNECTSICQASRPCNLGACADVLSCGPGLIATCAYIRPLSVFDLAWCTVASAHDSLHFAADLSDTRLTDVNVQTSTNGIILLGGMSPPFGNMTLASCRFSRVPLSETGVRPWPIQGILSLHKC